MPLALDLTSTFERGWILPVATTERAMLPCVTSASLEGSIELLGLKAALTPKKAPTSSTPESLARSGAAACVRSFRFFHCLPWFKILPCC